VNFLRISCARPNPLPVAGFQRSRKARFTAAGAISLLNSARNFFANLTIAVLGKPTMATYYPDTLIALADKNSIGTAQ
jgi:hypothetical protein